MKALCVIMFFLVALQSVAYAEKRPDKKRNFIQERQEKAIEIRRQNYGPRAGDPHNEKKIQEQQEKPKPKSLRYQ